MIALAAVLVLIFIGGLAATRRRDAAAPDYSRHVAEADRALEVARASDKGWDRGAMEEAARNAIAAERPGWPYKDLALVLVDDRPGVTEDRAHFVAVGEGEEIRVVLTRRDGVWVPESFG